MATTTTTFTTPWVSMGVNELFKRQMDQPDWYWTCNMCGMAIPRNTARRTSVMMTHLDKKHMKEFTGRRLHTAHLEQ